jgi:hypothetical protein
LRELNLVETAGDDAAIATLALLSRLNTLHRVGTRFSSGAIAVLRSERSDLTIREIFWKDLPDELQPFLRLLRREASQLAHFVQIPAHPDRLRGY